MTGNRAAPGIRFLFVMSPNNSGTTVMGQYLHSQTGGYLPPFGHNEGQHMPDVQPLMSHRRWHSDSEFDWPRIRHLWECAARDAGPDLFIECSPPNMVRVATIRAQFDPDAQYVFSISGPYSRIASTLYNYKSAPMTEDMLTRAAEGWIERATEMRRNIEENPDIPHITYEAFCADPRVLNQALGLPARPIRPLAGKKNDPRAEIQDMTAKNAAFLEAGEWDVVNATLARAPDLLAFFGYQVIPGADLLAEAETQRKLFRQGRKRRARWDRRGGRVSGPRTGPGVSP